MEELRAGEGAKEAEVFSKIIEVRTDGFKFIVSKSWDEHVEHEVENVKGQKVIENGLSSGGGDEAKLGVTLEEHASVHNHGVSDEGGGGRNRGS